MPPFERQKLHRLQEVCPTAIQAMKAFAHKAVLLKQAENVEGIVCKGLDPKAMHENLCPHLCAGQMIEPGQGRLWSRQRCQAAT